MPVSSRAHLHARRVPASGRGFVPRCGDVVAAYADLMADGRPGGVYNVGSGEPVTMAALLDGLVAAFGGTARVVVDESRFRAVDQPEFYADVTRLRADTGWQRRFGLEQTLRDLADWWTDRSGPSPG